MSTECKESLVNVWDPNGLNPYGQEVYSVIQEFQPNANMWLPYQTKTLLNNPHKVYAVLGRSAAEDGFLNHAVRRLFGPLAVALRAVCRQESILLIWTRGTYENVVFSIAALLTRVVVVHHNPVSSRMGGSIRRKTFLSLTRIAHRTLVHSDLFLPPQSAPGRKNYRTVLHPLYDRWAARFLHNRRASGSKTRVLLLGALRPDKGTDQLIDVAIRLNPKKYSLAVVGAGNLPDGFQDICQQRGLSLHLRVSPNPVEDSVIAEAIMNADVLLAPYRDATVSGTIIMAQTAGLPALAYDVGALRDEVDDRALASSCTPSDLVRVLDSWDSERFSTYRISGPLRRQLTLESWRSAVLSDRMPS